MALVREHGGYAGGFDAGGADVFDALGYGHDALLGFDAAAALLFWGGGSNAGAGYVADGGNVCWPPAGARASSSVLAFDRPAAAAAAAALSGEGEEEERDAWIDAADRSYGDAAARAPPAVSVGFDAATGCFTLTERAASSGGAGRATFGLLFPSTAAAAASSPECAAPVRASQKRTYVVSTAPSQFVSISLDM